MMEQTPELRMDHLRALTDSTGLIQHAIYSIPNRRTGYTTDDNARALVVALEHHDRTGDTGSLQLVSTYLSFLHYAQTESFRFHNFMSYDQMFLDSEGSDDSFGRTLVALGFALDSGIHDNVKRVAGELFDHSLRWIPSLSSSRSRAYALVGLNEYHRAAPRNEKLTEQIALLADSLVDMFQRNAEPDWPWFEPFLTYCNALLPHALFLAYGVVPRRIYLETAERAMGFLAQVTLPGDIFHPVGSNGWYFRGQPRAMFDQQPVDAASLVCCAKAAARATGEGRYEEMAETAFAWFFGRNTNHEALYDPVSGGCFDGLHENRVNLNLGAESTVAYLMAHLAAHPAKSQRLIPAP